MRKNKIIVSLLSLIIMFTIIFTPNLLTFAEDWTDYRSGQMIPETRISERVVDNADLLTNSQEMFLREKVNAIYEKYHYNVVIVTTYSLDEYTTTEYADNFYDYNGFSENGILFLISTEYRDWAISTSGDGVYAFTDKGQEDIVNSIRGYLSNDNWYESFNEFINQSDKYIGYYVENGNPYVQGVEYATLKKILISLILGVFIGLIVAGVRCSKNKRKMLGGETGYSTVSYIDGNVDIIDQYDRFIRNDHHERFVSTENSNIGGKSSNGSSTHTSSSSRTHGGSSGKF